MDIQSLRAGFFGGGGVMLRRWWKTVDLGRRGL